MMNERPNPDELLARVQADESRAKRGRLKIFFGYAAGVGKTYGMLQAAQRSRAEGIDVVIGYVEPHARPETTALVSGFEIVPPREVAYRGSVLREFDLDAALARHPKLILVDELAHTNAEGLRHAKRWQDVDELLDAGIDVFSTLNVQHLESLNDVIAQVTGILIRETLPDAVLEAADEIELIDITPEELADRLRQGKVYLPAQAERALTNFFQKSNLAALRELSLRQAAQRLQRDVDEARLDKAVRAPWATSERLLVCVGPSPSTTRVIRTAKRMAATTGGEWLAVSVDTQGEAATPPAIKQQIAFNLRLAEQLGAETHTLVGSSVAETLVEFARSHNVTRIVVGKTAQPRWHRVFSSTVVDELLDRCGEIDVYVITGKHETTEVAKQAVLPKPSASARVTDYVLTSIVVAICALAGGGLHSLSLAEANVVMVFLIGVALVASKLGRGPAVFSAVASVLVFDFLFVPPYMTFAVSDTQYVLTFVVMLGLGLLISELTARIRDQLRTSQQQEHRTARLFRLTRQLTELTGSDFLLRTAGQQLSEIFEGEAVVYLREVSDDGDQVEAPGNQRAPQLSLRSGETTEIAKHPINPVVAQWVADHGQVAGLGTDTLPNASALFVPLIGTQRSLGALGVRPRDEQRFLDPDQRRLLETCASLIALSLERDQSLLDANQAQIEMRAEQLRNSLLSSVSHDLRTPLAAIAGTSEGLLAGEHSPARRESLQIVVDESKRLARLVENLLHMARLESGQVSLDRQWHVMEELVGSALSRLRPALQDHSVLTDLPPDLPLLLVDGLLLEQVFVNIVENAARYTPAGSTIQITARQRGDEMEIVIADNGPGLPAGTEEKIFEKFFQANRHTPDSRRGVGLGLAICRAIVESHGGHIGARQRQTGGAEFVIRLPNRETAPSVKLDVAP